MTILGVTLVVILSDATLDSTQKTTQSVVSLLTRRIGRYL